MRCVLVLIYSICDANSDTPRLSERVSANHRQRMALRSTPVSIEHSGSSSQRKAHEHSMAVSVHISCVSSRILRSCTRYTKRHYGSTSSRLPPPPPRRPTCQNTPDGWYLLADSFAFPTILPPYENATTQTRPLHIARDEPLSLSPTSRLRTCSHE